MSGLETALYTIFAYLPLSALIAIPFFIAGAIKKKRSRKFKGFFVTGGIFLGIFILWLAAIFAAGMYGFGPGRLDAGSEDLCDAIFERSGEICYFDCSEGTITTLSGGGKYAPVLSPDKTKILYRRSVLGTAAWPPNSGDYALNALILTVLLINAS